MFDGKKKALTFSFDDGVLQDEQLINILNQHHLKGTFNLNSGLLRDQTENIKQISTSEHITFKSDEIQKVYRGHEVAVHTLTHPNLTTLEQKEIIRQVEEDRKCLSELIGYEVCGMAYPCGGTNNDERVAEIIRRNTGVKYARTIASTYSFDLQTNLYRFNPTIHFGEWEQLYELVKTFVDLKTDKPALFYIWGHSFEFNHVAWQMFNDVCKDLSNRDDIFYGTNREVLL